MDGLFWFPYESHPKGPANLRTYLRPICFGAPGFVTVTPDTCMAFLSCSRPWPFSNDLAGPKHVMGG